MGNPTLALEGRWVGVRERKTMMTFAWSVEVEVKIATVVGVIRRREEQF